MRRGFAPAALGVVAWLGACAIPAEPEAVQATPVTAGAHDRLDCPGLARLALGQERAVATLSDQQRARRLNATLGFLYVTSATPDLEPALALAKGERDATLAALRRRC
jgi:hypothetical protein